MKAVRVHAFGGPEVLTYEEIPEPTPGPGQVVVELTHADVMMIDTLIRSGWGQEIFPTDLPYVPGGGGAGHVRSVGEGVDPAWVGRSVAARTSSGYAEQILAEESEIFDIPEGLGLEQAAAVRTDGATAVSLVDLADGIRPGEWVLVTAASGGAGSLLVSLAHGAGARVVAAARGERKLALASERGADVTVDYSEPGWPERVREATGGAGADLTFDGGGGDLGSEAFDATADGGRFVTYGSSNGLTEIEPAAAERRRVSVRDALADGPPDTETARALVQRALDAASEGRIASPVGARFPLAEAEGAHTALAEREVVGKALLVI